MSPSKHPSPLPIEERFAVPACRERWLEFLDLEHATLAAPIDFARDGDDLVVRRPDASGRPVSQGGVPRPLRPQLLLQGASAAAFFAGRGFSLSEEDLERAVWDVAAGGPRLWLRETPASVRRSSAPTSVAKPLAALLHRLYGNRITYPAARTLFDALTMADASEKRGEFWVASCLRAFPALADPEAASARRRCLGTSGAAVRTAPARALAEKARAFLADLEPRVFQPGDSPLAAGGALGLERPPSSVAQASRELREKASQDAHGRRAVWIAVEPERWDSLSQRAFEAARLALGDRIRVVRVPELLPAPAAPDEWRREIWVPCGTVAGSVRFYEWFAEIVRSRPARARSVASDILASPSWAGYASDPTGDAPLPVEEAAAGASEPATPREQKRARSSRVHDAARRVENLASTGRKELALREAHGWIAASPGRSVETWFPLAAFLSAETGGIFAPWLEAIEAEREIAGGRPAEARERLVRIVKAATSSVEEKRSAKLRLAEVAAILGSPSEAARRAASWRREHGDAPASESVRALLLGASGLAREGRVECAIALLEEADRIAVSLPTAERLEIALSRARVYGLSGLFVQEDGVYSVARPLALSSGDDRIASLFLAQEARALLDRREYERAIVRLEEALTVCQDHPAERAEILLDLAATRYHAGQPDRCEALLADALAAASAAGRGDLARIARGNRIEILINRCVWGGAETEIASLEASARSENDAPRLLVALHHRSRLWLRRGLLTRSARDNSEARRIAESLGDRLEIGELWLEQGDRCLYEGDLDGARAAWETAAADLPDRCRSDHDARERLEELLWAERGGMPASAHDRVEALFAEDGYRAAETVARWVRIVGQDALPELCGRAERVLRASGGEALADRVFGGNSAAVAPEALREIRRAACAGLGGEATDGSRALSQLGIAGLAVRDPEGREVLRLGGPSERPAETVGRALDAGSARFELAIWPPVGEETAAAVALLLETLLFRAPPAAAESDFGEGWRRLGVVTADGSMEEPFHRLGRFAPQAVTVLVLGESGSGKEAVARAIHRLSPRSSGPFIPVNIAAIPAALTESELFGHARGAFTGADRERHGLLEEAGGGTIFFDEIGDLAPPLQSKLLRALQEREIRRVGENRPRSIDVRVVSATSRDLAKDVEAGRFREDLYYRLLVAVIRLPALRERGRDSVVLARHFLERYAREYVRGHLRLAPEAAATILSYPWPGNVRELQNAIAQAAALSDVDAAITSALLPETVRGARKSGRPPGDYRSRVDAHRRDLIADALEKAGGNRSRAARELGLSRQALLYLIRELKVPARPSGS